MNNLIQNTIRSANLCLTNFLNLTLSRVRLFRIDFLGDLYYDQLNSYRSPFTISSPYFVMFPTRNDNLFLKKLCLLNSESITDYLSYYYDVYEGSTDEWLDHTEKIISEFLEKSQRLSPHPMNFWMSRTIVRNYLQNTYWALDWIDSMRSR